MATRRFPAWLLPAALAASVLLVFGRSLPYAFTYDDRFTLVDNQAVRSVLPLGRFFTDSGTAAHPSSGMASGLYRPLPTLTFALDGAFWGLRPAPLRSENLLLHAVNGLLLFLLLARRLGHSPTASALGAGLFLLHPAQTETVVWITQRSNLLCLAGLLAALWCFSDDRRGIRAAGWAAFAAALLSKETAAVFPLLLILWDAVRGKPRPFGLYLGLIVMTAAYVLWRGHVVGQLGQTEFRAGGFWGNLMVGAASWWEYVKIIVAPLQLRVSRAEYVDDPWRSPWTWLGAGLLVLWTAGAALLAPRRREPAFFMAWVPVCLAPMLGLIPTDTFVAERFLYGPMVGVAGLAAWGWDAGGKRVRRGLAAVLVAAAALSFRQTGVWRDDLALWENAVRREPGNAFARASLGGARFERSQPAAAREEYLAALANHPSDSLAFAAMNNLARIENVLGRPNEGLAWAEKALALRPDAREPLYNKIIALHLLGKKANALRLLDDAARRDPDFPGWSALREKLAGS